MICGLLFLFGILLDPILYIAPLCFCPLYMIDLFFRGDNLSVKCNIGQMLSGKASGHSRRIKNSLRLDEDGIDFFEGSAKLHDVSISTSSVVPNWLVALAFQRSPERR